MPLYKKISAFLILDINCIIKKNFIDTVEMLVMKKNIRVFSYKYKDRHSVSSSVPCLKNFIIDENGDIYILMLDLYSKETPYLIPDVIPYRVSSGRNVLSIISYFKRKKAVKDFLKYIEDVRIVEKLINNGDYKKYSAKIFRISSIVKDIGKDRIDANYLLPDGDLVSYPVYIERNIDDYDDLISILQNKMEITHNLCAYCGSSLTGDVCSKCNRKDERSDNAIIGKETALVGFGLAILSFVASLICYIGFTKIPQMVLFVLFGVFFVSVIIGAVGLDKTIYKGSRIIKAKDLSWIDYPVSKNTIASSESVKWTVIKPIKDDKGKLYRDREKCVHCEQEYTRLHYANTTVFCPHCKKRTYAEDERGYWHVTPYVICIGEEQVAVVIQNENKDYILESQKYNLRVILKGRYIDAVEEAIELIKNNL